VLAFFFLEYFLFALCRFFFHSPNLSASARLLDTPHTACSRSRVGRSSGQGQDIHFRQMLTPVVFLISLLFAITSNALYFPHGSHNGLARRPSTGGTITVDPPSRVVRRQTSPSSTLKPIISVTNTNLTDWGSQTNQLCINAINMTSITNPAGVIPCYNVLSFNPNTGAFISEVRLLQVASLVQPGVMADSSNTGILFEFPHAGITNTPEAASIPNLFGKRTITKRQTSLGQVNVVDAFYMNGTADITQQY
jgi:hypothetical protein